MIPHPESMLRYLRARAMLCSIAGSLMLVGSLSARMAFAQEPAKEPAATVEKSEKVEPKEEGKEPTKEEKIETEKPSEQPSESKPAPEKKAPAERPKLPVYGYTDTPLIPGQPWKIHDLFRPHPKPVEPGAYGAAPSDAVVLFDGDDLAQWCHAGEKPGEMIAPRWTVKEGYFEIVPGTGSLQTLETHGSCQLHLEWSIPEDVSGDSQGRGNSGVLLMGLFEIQVLDSYQSRTYADGQAAAMYGMYPPMANAMRGPGQWQTYDIVFEAPVYEDGKLAKKANVSVFHNGLVMHHRREFTGHSTHKLVQEYLPGPPAGPLVLQEHKNVVRYRNIWLRPLDF